MCLHCTSVNATDNIIIYCRSRRAIDGWERRGLTTALKCSKCYPSGWRCHHRVPGHVIQSAAKRLNDVYFRMIYRQFPLAFDHRYIVVGVFIHSPVLRQCIEMNNVRLFDGRSVKMQTNKFIECCGFVVRLWLQCECVRKIFCSSHRSAARINREKCFFKFHLILGLFFCGGFCRHMIRRHVLTHIAHSHCRLHLFSLAFFSSSSLASPSNRLCARARAARSSTCMCNKYTRIAYASPIRDICLHIGFDCRHRPSDKSIHFTVFFLSLRLSQSQQRLWYYSR